MEAERMPDLVAALDWLRSRPRQVDPERIGLVGSSIGGSTTVLAMAADARKVAAAAVALSPPDSSDIWALQDDDRYRPHDVLFIADDREVASAEDMMDGAVRSEVVTTTVRGHGIVLLAEPEIRDAVVDWLRERVS
jgi:dienelactone hydrolase